eukprot:GHRQ01040035.1.p2 GENE.GHRQ01040035.1~~GHRQ01040035.1.p2  ORF type:complete len:102 (-),score=30.84 GHRQ01040035.1:54-359(-)
MQSACLLRPSSLQLSIARGIPVASMSPNIHARAGRRLAATFLQRLVAAAGIFRASQLRVNPRQRAAHALFKTYLDVVHVAKDEGDRLFRPRGAAGTQVRAC